MYRMLSWKYLKGRYDINYVGFLDWTLRENGGIVGVTISLWYILDEASNVFKHL